jgi:hypothetical protein
MDSWAVVSAVAIRQHMLIAVWQLKALGISDQAIADRIKHHGWRRLGRGIIALPGLDTPQRRLAAVVLSHARPTGAADRVLTSTVKHEDPDEDADADVAEDPIDVLVDEALNAGQAVTGLSALWLHGIASQPAAHHLRLKNAVGVTKRTAVTVRRGPWTGELVWIEGLPVVDIAQAFMDAAARDKDTTALALHHQLTKLIATADAKRKTTLTGLEERLNAAPRFVGAPALRAAIADLKGELSHSGTEKKCRAIVTRVAAKYGLTLHPRPFGVEFNGRTVGEADLAIVEIRLDIEVDGPHHLLPAQQAKDQLRDRRVDRAAIVILAAGSMALSGGSRNRGAAPRPRLRPCRKARGVRVAELLGRRATRRDGMQVRSNAAPVPRPSAS